MLRQPFTRHLLWLAPLTVALASCVVDIPTSHSPRAPISDAPPVSSATATDQKSSQIIDTSENHKRSTAPSRLHFIKDDMPAAYAEAKRTGRVLFVDAWAPWCHTCLSLQHYVFTDPSLLPYASRVVFASIDTDRASSVGFLSNHAVTVWPMLFVIDPSTDKILASWPGSLSPKQLRDLLDDAIAVQDASAPPHDPRRLLAQARAASAARQLDKAIALFDELLQKAPATWPRRSEAVVGKMWALYRKHAYDQCAAWGQQHVGQVKGAASPADVSWILLACADKLPKGPEQAKAQDTAINKLRAFTNHPPADATVDDKADSLAILADAIGQRGDKDGFKRLYERRVAMLEDAARRAPTPTIASTFDYPRAMSYIALGQGDKAITMLRKRIAQFPDAYEPVARLGEVLLKTGHPAEAIPHLDRALALAYGPRRMRYLKLKAAALGKLGKKSEQVKVLEQEVAGYRALSKGQVRPGAMEDALQRLQKAQQAK